MNEEFRLRKMDENSSNKHNQLLAGEKGPTNVEVISWSSPTTWS
jgi:hypothetical protein